MTRHLGLHLCVHGGPIDLGLGLDDWLLLDLPLLDWLVEDLDHLNLGLGFRLGPRALRRLQHRKNLLHGPLLTSRRFLRLARLLRRRERGPRALLPRQRGLLRGVLLGPAAGALLRLRDDLLVRGDDVSLGDGRHLQSTARRPRGGVHEGGHDPRPPLHRELVEAAEEHVVHRQQRALELRGVRGDVRVGQALVDLGWDSPALDVGPSGVVAGDRVDGSDADAVHRDLHRPVHVRVTRER